nr:hypothetical protein [Tanacetum cinerariifolium]
MPNGSASTSNRRGKAKTAQPWTTAKEITLCTAWCNVTDNYVTQDVVQRGFWSEVFAYFEKEMGGGTIRGYEAIIITWKHSIRSKVVAFSVVYDSVQRMNVSGSSNLALFQKAYKEMPHEQPGTLGFKLLAPIFAYQRPSIQTRDLLNYQPLMILCIKLERLIGQNWLRGRTSTSNRRGKAKTAQPWTTAKEITLCTAWCNVTDNYVTRDVVQRGFWSEVFAYFEKEIGGTIRGYEAIIITWKHSIRSKVAAFSVVYDSVQRMNGSGSSNIALFQKALAKFKTQYGHLFTMDAFWRILKNHPAWIEIEMSSFNQRRNNEV